MNVIESAKKHPVLLGSVAIGALLLIVLSMSGSDTVGGTPTDTASGNDLAVQSQAIQSDLQKMMIAAGAASEQVAAMLEAKKIDAQTTQNANQLAANIAAQQITAGAQVASLQSTLAAEIENKKTQRDVDLASISSNTTIATTQTVANALTTQAAYNAQVAMAAANRKCTSFGFGLFSSC